jgi:hypothetical protein
MKNDNKQINVAARPTENLNKLCNYDMHMKNVIMKNDGSENSLANVQEDAPPPLESDCAATEELHGGCCVSSCSPIEILSDVAEVSREEAEKMLEAAKSAFGNLDEPPPLVLP